MNIRNIIKDNTVKFSFYRAGNLYYQINVPDQQEIKTFVFPVPISDCGEATFKNFDKAIHFMRFIRKSLEENTFVPA